MQETTNLRLELYEPTDNANLLDGYNASMRKIDQRDGEISTLISGLSSTVTSYDGRITSAQNTATNAATAAATADGKAVAAAAKADAAKTAAEAAIGGDIIIIGDSFTDGGGEWPSLVASKTGRTVRNYAVAGAGFIAGSVPFITQLQNAIGDGLDGATDIIVYGGANDWYSNQSTAGMISAIVAFSQAVTNLGANIKLHIAFGNVAYAQQSGYNGYYPWYSAIMEGLRTAPVQGLIDYVCFWHFNRPSMFTADGSHPNDAGQAVIASYMMEILEGTYAGVNVTQVFDLIHDGQNKGKVFVRFVNGIVWVGIRGTSEITWTGLSNNSFNLVCSVGNGASQYSLMFDGSVNTDWHFAPLMVFAGNASSLCIVRFMFNIGNKNIYMQPFGDASQLHDSSYTWDGGTVTWTTAAMGA